MNNNTAEIVAYFGLRLRVYKRISLSAGIRWGLTPFMEFDQSDDRYNWKYDNIEYLQRGLTVSARYRFGKMKI